MKKILLSVAGFDPSSGAGLILDVKVFEEFHFYGMGILTSVTSQNTEKVKKIECLDPHFIWEQFQTLKEDVSLSGIKVGMLGCKDNLDVIQKILRDSRNIPSVVDPVFKSTSGTWLLERDVHPSYMEKIKDLASVITPNTEEAHMISGIPITSVEDMKKSAEYIFEHIQTPCFIKGGNFNASVVDTLYDGREFFFYENEKMSKEVHGTGCFLSSALLCLLAQGKPLPEACRLASQLTHRAREKAIKIGRGKSIIPFPLDIS